MPKIIDLTGQRFGTLVVISKDVKNKKSKDAMWICKCDCGTVTSKRSSLLRSGNTKSCSHSHPRISRKSHGKGPAFVDKSGRRQGRLTVIGLASGNKDKYGNYLWICRCDCGNEKILSGRIINPKSRIKSCGCLSKEFHEREDSKLIRKMFGNLIVLNFSESSKERGRIYYCRCTCGNYINVSGNGLRSGKVTSCGCVKKYKYGNLVGHVFGSWTILSLSINQKSRRTWRCKCICGKEKDVYEFSLIEGSSKSCGCTNQYESVIATQVKKYFKEKHGGIPEWNVCKNPRTNYSLRCDIYVPKSNAYIEINGEQHYNPRNSFVLKHKKFYQDFSYRQNLDKLKREYAESHGIYVEVDLRKIKTVEDAIAYIEERI